jgi:pimeloyl-ACP methyl ester carboxylesterase
MPMIEPRLQTIVCSRLQVAYFESGSGEPLVLVHGGESSCLQFVELMPYLGEGIRAIAYDQRDSGLTVSGDEPYVVADLASDLAAFIESLGVERAHVLGTSFGGMVALHAALDHPEQIASVILVATVPSASLLGEVVGNITTMSPEARREALINGLYTPAGLAADPDLSERGRRVLIERTPDQMSRRLASVRDHHVTDRLSEMTTRTLVLHGTDDPLAPFSAAELMAVTIPGATLRPIEGARHGVASEFPAEVAAIVREFLGLGPNVAQDPTDGSP